MKKFSEAKTDKDFAEIAGVSLKKIRQAKKVRAANPELADEVIAGKVTLDEAVKMLGPEKVDQALQVSAIPTDEFEALVESPNPPTVKALAKIGKKHIAAKTKKAKAPAKPKATKKEQARAKAGFPTYKESGGRRDDVLALVTRKKGVTLEELMEKFEWQAHTARGFMSRLKDEFLKLESFKAEDGARTYRLVSK